MGTSCGLQDDTAVVVGKKKTLAFALWFGRSYFFQVSRIAPPPPPPPHAHHTKQHQKALLTIRNDINVMPKRQQIQCRLGNADVALDADNGNIARRLQFVHHLGDGHAELGLVPVARQLRMRIDVELGNRRAEFPAVLGRREDGDGENLGGAQELVGRREEGGEAVDGGGEGGLQVADAVEG